MRFHNLFLLYLPELILLCRTDEIDLFRTNVFRDPVLRDLQSGAFKAAKFFKKPTRNKRTPILCAVFINLHSSFSRGILTNNFRRLGSYCEWGIIAYQQQPLGTLQSLMKLAISYNSRIVFCKSPDSVHIPSSGVTFRDLNYSHTPKPLLYLELLPYLRNYNEVWLLDEDISFVGFNMTKYLQITACAQFPRWPLLSQPIIAENTQIFAYLNQRTWHGEGILAAPSPYIEQQVPMMDASFLAWYLRHVVSPLRRVIAVLGSDWGHDHTWCAAAAVFAREAYGWPIADAQSRCLIVTATAVRHRRSKSLQYRTRLNEFFALGLHMESLMTSHFPDWRKDFGRETVNMSLVIRSLDSPCTFT